MVFEPISTPSSSGAPMFFSALDYETDYITKNGLKINPKHPVDIISMKKLVVLDTQSISRL